MSLRFTKSAGNQYIRTTTADSGDFPNSDWTVCLTARVFGPITSGEPEYLVSTANLFTADQFQMLINGNGSTQNGLQCYVKDNGQYIHSVLNHLSGELLYVVTRIGTSIFMKSCPLLTVEPTDGSAVTTTQCAGLVVNTALNQNQMTIGARNDLVTNRLANQSIERFFTLDSSLTDFEIAQLAYGYTVQDLGKTPKVYIPFTSDADFTDTAGSGFTFTKNGSPTTDTAMPYALPSTPSNTIGLTDQTNHRVFQRIGTSANIVFSGTNAGDTPSDIQVQLYAADGTTVLQAWTTLTSATITSTTFTGTLSVPQYQNMYRFAVRSRDAGGNVLATSNVSANQWGVGDIWLLIGSSGAEYWATSFSATGLTSNAGVKRYNQSDTWAAGGSNGAIITAANSANTALGVAIGFMECGVAGTTLANWAAQDANWTEAASDIANVGGKLGLVNVHLGNNDAANGTVASKAQHYSNFLTFIGNIRTATGQSSLPIFISGSNGRTNSNNQQFDWIREVEKELGNESNVYFGATTVDLEINADTIHLTAAGYQNALARLSLAHLDIFGSGFFHRGAYIGSHQASGTSGTVNIVHVGGTDITVNAVHGFTATDGSGALAITACSRASANTISLTYGRPINGSVTLKYASGARPFESGQGVRDNTALSLPLEVETDGIINTVIAPPSASSGTLKKILRTRRI